MDTKKLNVGLVIALPVKDSDQPLSELEKFTMDQKADIILFPEDHIYSEKLPDLQAIARNRKKWIISGMEDRDTGGEKFKQAVVVNPKGDIVGRHHKTSLTYDELSKKFSHGNAIQAVETDFGLVGVAICYEAHFAEVARIYALQGAKVIFNPIGTGMWHETQFQQWTSVGRTRASENGIFCVGCTHQNGAIPMAYAYGSDGGCLVETRDVNRMVMVTLDLSQCFDMFLEHRQPQLYKKMIEERKAD
jgi:predicted amidohydrolase